MDSAKMATPRPWRHEQETPGCNWHDIWNDDGEPDFCVAKYLEPEDANLIVRAVNAFEPLVEALKQIATCLPGMTRDEPLIEYMQTIASNALRLAGELEG